MTKKRPMFPIRQLPI
uniref:Uncharacterized protein n=1 Tax=Rhizophora mucronata TaxID=61149 RepID=A0A2P2R416_RHIMU